MNPSKSLSRRQWLKRAGVAAVGAGLTTGCRPRSTPSLGSVNVSEDRVIRTTVGLRPFRPTGFRNEVEIVGTKTIVHNYGHGGGGMSLSWGSSHLAVDKALETGATSIAVLGCGVMGLSCGRLLQKRGLDVTIYTKDLPPNTTSSMSAAWWSPGSTADPSERTEAYNKQFVEAARLANRYYQDYVGNNYGVRWMERYSVSEEPPDSGDREGPTTSDLIGDLFPEQEDLAPGAHSFPWPYVRRSWTMVIEPTTYLNALLRDFRVAGGKLVKRTFDTLDEVVALSEPVLLNCTGLGARALFGDETLVPIKGQLTVLLPQAELDYIMVGGGLYMIPRRDGVVLGGTHERDDWSLEPSRTEMHRVMEGHKDFWGQMS